MYLPCTQFFVASLVENCMYFVCCLKVLLLSIFSLILKLFVSLAVRSDIKDSVNVLTNSL